jgi:hypothetical protein
MPKLKNTWQSRGEYLANCCGLSTAQFAAGLDSAMSGNRQNIASKPARGRPAGTGTKTTRRKRATATAQPAGS